MNTPSDNALYTHRLQSPSARTAKTSSKQNRTLVAFFVIWLAILAIVSALANLEGLTGESMVGISSITPIGSDSAA
jgi:hypothetical protein